MTTANLEMRDAFIAALFLHAKKDRDIVFLTNDYGAPSLDQFREELPEQFVNMGIAEQNIISVAAGMALGGKRVYVYSIASFITLRCLEQIKIDLCCMDLPVTIIGVGGAYGYSADGPTHHATEDIALMRAIAGMQIYCPADANSSERLVDLSLHSSHPMYVRLDKGKYPLLYDRDGDLSAGFSRLREGDDVCIVATGTMVHRAKEAAEELEKHDIRAGVVDTYRVKPFPQGLQLLLSKQKRIVSIEEHTLCGGLGSSIAETIGDNDMCIPLKRFGISDDQLYAYGLRDALHQERGIDRIGVVESILTWVRYGNSKGERR